MDKEKISDCIHNLKVFFISKGLKVSEVREIIYRLLDYIDVNFNEDERDELFKLNGLNNNNNGKNYKQKEHHKGINLEVKARYLSK